MPPRPALAAVTPQSLVHAKRLAKAPQRSSYGGWAFPPAIGGSKRTRTINQQRRGEQPAPDRLEDCPTKKQSLLQIVWKVFAVFSDLREHAGKDLKAQVLLIAQAIGGR